MALPEVLFIGPLKTGTTWIDDYIKSTGLGGGPGSVKETFYFDKFYKKGTAWYSRFFRSSISPIIEVAPGYFAHPEAPTRVKSTLGNPRIVITLREPISRIYSHYVHLCRYGITKNDGILRTVHEYAPLLSNSMYTSHIQRWIRHFGNDVFVLVYEELHDDPASFAGRIANILGCRQHVADQVALYRRSNERGLSSNPWLASVTSKLALSMRASGLYSLIPVAAIQRLKPMVYGSAGKTKMPGLTDYEHATLSDILRPEIERWQHYRHCMKI